MPSYCSYPLIPLIYFPFRRWKFIKFTLSFPACIFTIHNTTTSVAHFSYIFLIKTKFRFANVFRLLGNIKQPPLTPKLSTMCVGVDLTLPTMTSHGAYTTSWVQVLNISLSEVRGTSYSSPSRMNRFFVILFTAYHRKKCFEIGVNMLPIHRWKNYQNTSTFEYIYNKAL